MRGHIKYCGELRNILPQIILSTRFILSCEAFFSCVWGGWGMGRGRTNLLSQAIMIKYQKVLKI